MTPRPLAALIVLACLTISANSARAQIPDPGPVSHYEFAQWFEPTPGRHCATMIHPTSGRPVHVCFTLPPGRPQVRTYQRRIIFDYGTSEVEIHFALCGTVQVHTILLGY